MMMMMMMMMMFEKSLNLFLFLYLHLAIKSHPCKKRYKLCYSLILFTLIGEQDQSIT